jgi:DNA-binding NtrC family response regulator
LTRLLFVTPDRSSFADLTTAIKKQGGIISWAATGRQAREAIRKTPVDLVLTDERLDDMSGLELIKQLVADDPMINCAAISSLSKEAYHEASEGLGILMQLPSSPKGADGERLMGHLNHILSLTKAER